MRLETYLCEKCKTEFSIDPSEFRKKRDLCPNGCTRNHLIYLGDTEEEIKKRKAQFEKEDPLRNIEINPEIDGGEDEMRRGRSRGEVDSTGLGLGY